MIWDENMYAYTNNNVVPYQPHTFPCTESIEARKPHVSSINEDKKDNNEEKALATTSQKLDDDSILEALEVHEKLK